MGNPQNRSAPRGCGTSIPTSAPPEGASGPASAEAPAVDYRTLLEGSPDMIWRARIHGSSHRFIDASPSSLDVLGVAPPGDSTPAERRSGVVTMSGAVSTAQGLAAGSGGKANRLVLAADSAIYQAKRLDGIGCRHARWRSSVTGRVRVKDGAGVFELSRAVRD